MCYKEIYELTNDNEHNDLSNFNVFSPVFKKYSYENNKYGDYWYFKIEKHELQT